ncbi:type-F conjugative transfer system protein TraW [Henriciella pelagia]|uniref:type-F conjugative transfer system protein TraW n=1 Tax=Henriciella pelagia TaxID=1977912 RepID=UPI003512BCC2
MRLVASVALAWAGSIAPGVADDFGTMGETFEIAEPDLLLWIQERLRAAEDSGDLDTMNEEFAARVERNVRRPAPVDFVEHAEETRSWYYDPTVTVPEDYADHNGVVFARAGEQVNPLETMTLRRGYVFIDGDDDDQVAWALERYREDDGNVSIILVRGAPLELMDEHQVRFFFDQTGFLVERLGVRAVPASFEQEGTRVRVTEHGPAQWRGRADEVER